MKALIEWNTKNLPGRCIHLRDTLVLTNHHQSDGQGVDLLFEFAPMVGQHRQLLFLRRVQIRARGNTNPIASPSEVFECAEGRLIIAAGNNTQFGQLCTVLGAPDMATDPRFATNATRCENHALLKRLIETVTLDRENGAWRVVGVTIE